MVLPPSKRRKAPKKLGLDVQAFFQSLRVQQVAPTSLCKGGKKVNLISLDEARFSHFIDSLKPVSLMLTGLFYAYIYNSFK